MNRKLVYSLGSVTALAVLVGCAHTISKREIASVDSKGRVLGEEVIPPTEEAATKEILELVKAGYSKPKPADPTLRIIHAKQHGCVRAEFKINSDIPEKFRHGIFSEPGAVYPAWARLSNGAGKAQHDSMPDARGLAIKLMNVDGPKLADEKETQDLLLQSSPIFFAADVAAYVKFMKFSAKGGAAGVGDLIRSVNIKDPNDRREIKLLVTDSAANIKNPLTAEYFSALPQKLGPHAMKMKAAPCAPKGPEAGLRDKLKKNFLNEVMTEQLAKSDACIELSIQLQTDAVEMPIENATVKWDPSLSPFVSVAKLYIPKQNFSSERRQEFCQHISFNPWHSIEAHRPLGGLNRVRKLVYEHSQKYRLNLNNQQRSEPQASEMHE